MRAGGKKQRKMYSVHTDEGVVIIHISKKKAKSELRGDKIRGYVWGEIGTRSRQRDAHGC